MRLNTNVILLLITIAGAVTMLPQIVPVSTGGGSTPTPSAGYSRALPDMGTTTWFGFPGLLYTDPAGGGNTNTVPAQHDADGRAIAAMLTPLDSNGNPTTTSNGLIGIVGIGMSNWTNELCMLTGASNGGLNTCNAFGDTTIPFIPTERANSQVATATTRVVDCAHAGVYAWMWIDTASGWYNNCTSNVFNLITQVGGGGGMTAKQVQVVIWKDADNMTGVFPCPQGGASCASISTATSCSYSTNGGATWTSNASTLTNNYKGVPTKANPEACLYEQWVGMVARQVQQTFPNVRIMFVHSRIYAGYAASGTLNPEPFAYEYGFATKWLINAQMLQAYNGTVDPVAGNLMYSTASGWPPSETAPWINWGAYWWADGLNTCSLCEIPTTWTQADYGPDYTHPTGTGIAIVVSNMMHFFLNSPYTAWFRH